MMIAAANSPRAFAGMSLLRPANETLRTPETTPPPSQLKRPPHDSVASEAGGGKKKEGRKGSQLLAAVTSMATGRRTSVSQTQRTLNGITTARSFSDRRSVSSWQPNPNGVEGDAQHGEQQHKQLQHLMVQEGADEVTRFIGGEDQEEGQQEGQQPLLSVPIETGDAEPYWIHLYADDDPIAVARAFSQEKGLQEWQQDALAQALAEQYQQAVETEAGESEQTHDPPD
jgi:hypothetical protein